LKPKTSTRSARQPFVTHFPHPIAPGNKHVRLARRPILSYSFVVTETVENLSRVVPSAAPCDDEIAAWQALPRDEQLRRLQARLTHPDCAAVSDATMSDILNRAQAAAKLRQG